MIYSDQSASVGTDILQDPQQRKSLLERIAAGSIQFGEIPEAAWNDREMVLALMRRNGQLLQYASEDFRDDREVVLAAVQQTRSVLQYASEALRGDREVVLVAVQKEAVALLYISEDLRDNREVMLAAVQKDGHALQYARAALRDNREIALAAVQQNGFALEYVSANLRADCEVITQALKNNIFSFFHARYPVRCSPDQMIEALQTDWRFITLFEPSVITPELVRQVIERGIEINPLYEKSAAFANSFAVYAAQQESPDLWVGELKALEGTVTASSDRAKSSR